MARLSNSVLGYWRRTFATECLHILGNLSFHISDTLDPKRPAMILELTDGSVQVAVTPDIAERSGIAVSDDVSPDDLKRGLRRAGVTLHDPDYLFYLSTDEPLPSGSTKAPRQLTDADRTAFDIFYNTASEQDREDAWVELHHWAVFGCFDGDRLVSAASMNLWNDSLIADLGVLTLPDARGKGIARAVVQAINMFSRQQGYEPQYRCQLDNQASVALAKSSGLTLFGQWTVASDPRVPGKE
ncbi:GNAT family N-acetyltransferase [Sphingomonas sp. ASY06-1R]|uniref:GNAT family N-acetyltransferase n=1 Tax=Sphingomonas sp. ASY06-1R TaxID=3445771 RepID=UPI003FA1BD9A